MSTNAVSAHGTLLKVGDAAAPEVFTTILEVRSISGPSLDSTIIDVTSQDSASHAKEKIQGLLDSGQVTFTCNWKPDHATHSATVGLMYLYQNRTARNYQLVVPTSPTVTCAFRALVKSPQPNFDMDGALELAVTLDITGPVTWS